MLALVPQTIQMRQSGTERIREANTKWISDYRSEFESKLITIELFYLWL